MGLGNITFGGNNVRFGNDADKPTSPNPGDEYIALDTRKKYICYTDGEWEPVTDMAVIYKEIQRLDKKVWNTETELNNFVFNGTFIPTSNSEIILGNKSTLTTVQDSNTSSAVDNTYLLKCTSKNVISKIHLKTASLKNDGLSEIGIMDIDENILYSKTHTGDDVLEYEIPSETDFYIYTVSTGYLSLEHDVSYPYVYDDVEITGKKLISNENLSYDTIAIYEEINFYSPRNAGSAISPAVTPANLAKWEYAYFEIDPDGETITADILDAADDSVLIENISDGESLHDISSDKNLKIRFNLSRQDTANIPKVYNAILKWINVLS